MDQSNAPWRALDVATTPDRSTNGPDAVGERHRQLVTVVALVAAGLLAIGAFLLATTSSGRQVEVAAAAASSSVEPSSQGDEVVVEVDGAVVRPGLVRLPRGARIADALAGAGGYGPRVDVGRAEAELNLAAHVEDGSRIHVPSRDESPPAVAATDAGEAPSSGLIDLNSATEAELDTLPGIGPVTAQKIIAGRAEQPFATVDDLRTRKIVGASTFDKIRDLVTVR